MTRLNVDSARCEALSAASSLARAGRKPGRLCHPGLPGHRQLKAETLRGPGTTARSAEKDLKHGRHVTAVADWSRR
jgi:hypothetical protein